MKLSTLIFIAAAALGTMAFAAPPPASNSSSPEGLVALSTWNFDELYVRPNAALVNYRKVMVDPVQIAFAADWNQSQQDYRGKTRRLQPFEVQAIADDMASTMQSSVVAAFKSRGYEVVSTPGPGVLRLSASALDLYVNAGDQTPPGATRLFTKDAGEATMILEARDSESGSLLARIVDHRTAPENKGTRLSDLRRTTNVVSDFWFNEMFTRWATACAKQFETTT